MLAIELMPKAAKILVLLPLSIIGVIIISITFILANLFRIVKAPLLQT